MELEMEAEVDLFGDLVVPLKQKWKKADEEVAQFTLSDIEKGTEYICQYLIDDMQVTMHDYLAAKDSRVKGANNDVVQVADLLGFKAPVVTKRELFEQLAWVYDLYDASAVLPFEAVCIETGHDPQVLRNVLSRKFATEIKQFVGFVSSVNRDLAGRMALRLSDYVSVAITREGMSQ